MSAIDSRYKTWKYIPVHPAEPHLIACLVASPLHPLLFQAAKEAFNHGIIPTIPFTTHAAFCSGQQIPDSLFPGVLSLRILKLLFVCPSD